MEYDRGVLSRSHCKQREPCGIVCIVREAASTGDLMLCCVASRVNGAHAVC